jgi:lysophospholipase L1-like esterase
MRRGWLIVAMAAAGCAGERAASPAAPAEGRTMTYLALGDSYTIGESVPADQRWPVQLAALLRAEGLDVAEPRIIARTGWTTDELDAGIDAAAPAGPFDLVSLSIGVNNQFRGRPVVEYGDQFAALLARAIDFAGARPERVFVVSIPDWGATPYAANDPRGRTPQRIGAEIDAFNQTAARECRRLGVTFIDITPGSRRARRDAELIASDGLHPSGKMYAEWAAAALPAARGALR